MAFSGRLSDCAQIIDIFHCVICSEFDGQHFEQLQLQMCLSESTFTQVFKKAL